MSIRIEPLTGPRLPSAIEALARLRITVFRDWPYLYDGSMAYERQYLQALAEAPHAVVVAAYDADDMIGAATGSALAGHAEEFAGPLRHHGFDVDRMFYCGESVLLPAYRGRGLGHAFFDGREAHALVSGPFSHATFCAVVRPDDHPLRPRAYAPLDSFWRKRGYEKVDGLIGSYSWKDLDQPGETSKPMQYWMKALRP